MVSSIVQASCLSQRRVISSVTAAYRNQQLHMSQEDYINRKAKDFLWTLEPSCLLNHLFKAICLN